MLRDAAAPIQLRLATLHVSVKVLCNKLLALNAGEKQRKVGVQIGMLLRLSHDLAPLSLQRVLEC